MLATFIALYVAHILADFVLQPNRLIKLKRTSVGMALHLVIVLVAVITVTGTLHPGLLLFVAATHLTLDVWKQLQTNRQKFTPFIIDQGGHLLSLALAAALFPMVFEQGFWGAGRGSEGLSALGLTANLYLVGWLVFGGAVLAVRAGGFAVASLFQSLDYADPAQQDSLPAGGQTIGYLERALVFFFVLTQQMAVIGFLIAAKSFLRFGEVQERKASEYVIIGTLASFGWALAVSWSTGELLSALDWQQE